MGRKEAVKYLALAPIVRGDLAPAYRVPLIEGGCRAVGGEPALGALDEGEDLRRLGRALQLRLAADTTYPGEGDGAIGVDDHPLQALLLDER